VRAAWQRAPGFRPTRRLLIHLLIDAGDTAEAMRVVRSAPALDSTLLSGFERQVALRYSVTSDSGTGLMNAYPAWHRYRALPDFTSALRRTMPAGMPATSLTQGVAIFVLPSLIATGRLDSARALARAALTPSLMRPGMEVVQLQMQ